MNIHEKMDTLIHNIEGAGRRSQLERNLLMNKKFGWAMSSVDETKISLTIKGLVKFIPAVLILTSFFGLQLDGKEISLVLDSVLGVVAAGFALYGAIQTLVGAARKVAVRLNLYPVDN